MRVGIIGAGLQGKRRAPIVRDSAEDELVMVAAADLESAQALARRLGLPGQGCRAAAHWRQVVEHPDIDAVIVCTPPDSHAEISIAAMEEGKHVLCEKPLARTLEEAQRMLAVAQGSGVILKCGFNHRHHPGIQTAKRWIDEGAIGRIDFIRCRYGICGRPGYEKEWRANPQVVSGGQLMEQGIHAVDLFRWFLTSPSGGDLTEAFCFRGTRFFPIHPLEDNAFALFRTAEGQVAFLHSSLTQWKNLFSFEVFGQEGYILVEGLGVAYGTERAVLGYRAFDRPFQEESIEFRGEDPCWREEWQEFKAAVREKRSPLGSGLDGLEAMRLVFAAYESAQTGAVVRVEYAGSGAGV